MREPVYSVIIPTYNRSGMLREAIRSVIDQSFQDFEILVIDDHSTDDTRNAVEEFNDDRIQYILNDRQQGGAGTRNCGIFRAKGRWTAFLDDDDIWLPEKLEIQYNKIKEIDHSTGFLYSGYSYKSPRKRWDGHVFTPRFEGQIMNDLLYDNYIGALCTVLIRTDILKEIGGFDERFRAHQDIDLYVRAAAVTKVAFVKDCLATVTLHSENRITLDYEKKLEACLLFWEKHADLIKLKYRLLHRIASRVFVFAVALGNVSKIQKCLIWALSGAFIDPKNFIWMMRSTLSIYFKSKLQKRSME